MGKLLLSYTDDLQSHSCDIKALSLSHTMHTDDLITPPYAWHRYIDVIWYGWSIKSSVWHTNQLPISSRWRHPSVTTSQTVFVQPDNNNNNNQQLHITGHLWRVFTGGWWVPLPKCQQCEKWSHKNIERQTAYTIVSWPMPWWYNDTGQLISGPYKITTMYVHTVARSYEWVSNSSI